MTTYGALLEDYRTNMRVILAFMVLVLVSFLFVMGFIVAEESFAGALACLGLWLVYVILYSVSILLVAINKSEAAAMMGLFLAWAIPFGIRSMSPRTIVLVSYSILPGILTFLIARMLWMTYRIESLRPEEPVMDYPVSNPPRVGEMR